MIKAIFIEAGHGTKKRIWPLKPIKDCGAVGNGYQERDIAKELARRVISILKTKKELNALIQGVGIETDATIQAKMQYVNTVMNENHFSPSECVGLAIHMNAINSPIATGFEVWHQIRGQSRALAGFMVRAWDEYKITPLRPRSINNNKDGKYGRFYTDDTSCPYLIVETSFISNPKDVKAITFNYDRAAECIAHGLLEYIRSL